MSEQALQSCHCPRCGYDQRGVIATWIDACPLQGTCSECGLQINWAEVLVPHKFEPQWCVEFVPRLRRFPMATARTFFNSFRPWRFWSQLKMSQPIRWRRLASYVVLLWLLLLASYAIAQGTMAARMRYLVQQQCAAYPRWINSSVRYERMNLDALTTAKAIKSMNDEERAAALQNVPPGFDLAPNYQQFIEDLATMPDDMHDNMIARKQQTLNALQAQASAPPKILHSYLAAIFEGVFLPVAQTSFGRIQLGDGTLLLYPAPIQIHDQISSATTGKSSWSDDLAWRVGLTLTSIVGLLILMPVSFVLLPASRRRAKVNWSHVVRIVIYSQFALVIAIVLSMGVSAWHLITESTIAMHGLLAIPLIAWIGITIWWAAAIRRYLKMQHAEAVAVIMSLMLALLLSPLLFQVLPGWITRFVFD